MNTCSRCNNDLHRDFPDKTERCSGCDRIPTWCRCSRVESKRTPEWLSRARQTSRGLARDLTLAA